jgi:hypothetical protein
MSANLMTNGRLAVDAQERTQQDREEQVKKKLLTAKTRLIRELTQAIENYKNCTSIKIAHVVVSYPTSTGPNNGTAPHLEIGFRI